MTRLNIAKTLCLIVAVTVLSSYTHAQHTDNDQNVVGIAILAAISEQAIKLESQKRYGEAEPLRRQHLTLAEKNNTGIQDSLFDLAINLGYHQKRYREAEPLWRRHLELAEKKKQNVKDAIYWLADNLRKQKRDQEAEPLWRRHLELAEKNKSDVKNSLSWLASNLNSQKRYSEEEPLRRQHLALAEKNNTGIRDSLLFLAGNLEKQKRYKETEPLLRRQLTIAEKSGNPEDPDILKSLERLAENFLKREIPSQELPVRRRILERLSNIYKAENKRVLSAQTELANVLNKLERFTDAEKILRTAVIVSARLKETPNAIYIKNLEALAQNLSLQKRYKEAEEFLHKAIKKRQKKNAWKSYVVLLGLYKTWKKNDLALQTSLKAIQNSKGLSLTESSGENQFIKIALLADAAMIINNGGYTSEAIDRLNVLLQQLSSLEPNRIKPEHVYKFHFLKAHINLFLANIHFEEHHYKSTLNYLKPHLQIMENYPEANLKDSHIFGLILNTWSISKVESNLHKVEQYFKKLKSKIIKSYGQDSRYLIMAQFIEFEILVSKDQFDLALEFLPKRMERMERWQLVGRSMISSWRRRIVLAFMKLSIAEKYYGMALKYADQFYDLTLKPEIHAGLQSIEFEQTPTAPKNIHLYSKFVIDFYIRNYEREPFADKNFNQWDKAFQIKQLSSSSTVDVQLRKMANRSQAENGPLNKLVRQKQDTIIKLKSLYKLLMDGYTKGQKLPESLNSKQVQKQIKLENIKVNSLNNDIKKQFPRYTELTRRKILSFPEVQDLLQEGEVLITFINNSRGDKTHLFLVRQNKYKVLTVNLGSGELEQLVKRIRKSITPVNGRVPNFDLGASFKLFDTLLGPAKEFFKSARHLIFIPRGPLLSIPFGILTTDRAEKIASPIKSGTIRGLEVVDTPRVYSRGSTYKSAAWLLKKYALTTLPSVASLKLLRRVAKKSKAHHPFIGFGDPILLGKAKKHNNVNMTSLYRGGIADVNKVRQLQPLPETSFELHQIAKILNADEKEALYLRERATETKVKSVKLETNKVIAFATHGLLSTETRQLGEIIEPALVMTPPKFASKKDDGLLTASEIAQLKLDADFVILSACNTAAGQNKNAEGLSGLAKAFFYAGARSLLVSHWPVESKSATKLTTTLFKKLRENPNLSKTEAFRQSMLLMASAEEKSHPFYWAPFSIIGDGR